MFERFSNHAKQLMSQARLASLRLQHEYIAPEHLLLGLLALPDCHGAQALLAAGASLASLRGKVEALVAPGERTVAQGQLPFTPEAKHVLERTLEHAETLGHYRLGTEHVLLALADEPSLASRALAEAGLDGAKLRAAVKRVLATGLTLDRSAVRALLISNSTMHGGGYLEHCAAEIRDFLGARQRVLFVPYALADHDGYAAKARAALAAFGHDVVSAHEGPPLGLVAACTAVFVGGGNTFRLLAAMYRTNLLAAIQGRALHGMPYVGSSAGTNVATRSIRTTNDMPIVMPPSFEALQLVPFQINPHYLDPDPTSKHMGETREERLRQFHEESDVPVLALREGCMLRVEGARAELKGTTNARLFRRGEAPVEHVPPCDLSFLLRA
jgi:dipeptidase E